MSNLVVTHSPHIHSGESTRRIMLDVIIALIPSLIASVVFFGPRALLLTGVTILTAVISEAVSRKIMNRDPKSVLDLTAVITALLLALSLPASMPLWMAATGAIVAIVVVKQFFGGVGQNFVNPAIAGRLMLTFSYPIAMSAAWTQAFDYRIADAVTTATPLGLLAEGAALPSLRDLFLGIHAGSMGETSILALLLGAGYLLIRRVISPVIPFTFIGAAMLLTALAGQPVPEHLFSGSLIFAAFFMATDYVTSPITFTGKIIFGVGCGFITAVIRLFAALPEGVSFAIIIMNILVPHIERLTLPKAFGSKKGDADE